MPPTSAAPFTSRSRASDLLADPRVDLRGSSGLLAAKDEATERQRRRFQVRPGITGWAQVKGRNTLTFTQRFELDLWYLDHRTHRLDLKIILMTATRAFRGRGIYATTDTTMPRFDGHN